MLKKLFNYKQKNNVNKSPADDEKIYQTTGNYSIDVDLIIDRLKKYYEDDTYTDLICKETFEIQEEKILKFLLKKYQYDYICKSIVDTKKSQYNDVTIFKHILLEWQKYDIASFNNTSKKGCITKKAKNKIVDLKDDIIFTNLWSEERFYKAFNNIKTEDFEFKPNNHYTIEILELGIYLVINGNHSISSGIVKGFGTIECEYQLELFKLFDDFPNSLESLENSKNLDELMQISRYKYKQFKDMNKENI